MTIGREVRRAMIAHARRDAPRECCGLLVGTPRRVHAAVPCRNLARSVTRYTLDPRDHIRLRRELRETRLSIVGVYHSHPKGPARPSPADIAEARYSDWVYAIVSLAGRRAQVRAFRLRTNGVARIRLTTTASVSYRVGV